MAARSVVPHIRRLLAAEPGSAGAIKEQHAIEHLMMAALQDGGRTAAEALVQGLEKAGYALERPDAIPWMWRVVTPPPRVLELWFTGRDEPIVAALSYRLGKPWGSKAQRAANERQAEFYRRYEALGTRGESKGSRDDRLIARVGAFEADSNNGGFGQYLGNKGLSPARAVLRDLEAIGAKRTASWLSAAIEARKDPEALAKLDERFFERPEDLASLVMRHLSSRKGELLRFPTATKRDPAIDAWFESRGELGALGRHWFERMRACGGDVRELLHDGHPTACVGDAAFGYVNVFTAHVNVGFFVGAHLADPARLLEGTGRNMRHVKLRPGLEPHAKALDSLIRAAYARVKWLSGPTWQRTPKAPR